MAGDPVTAYRITRPLPPEVADYELYMDGETEEFRSTTSRYAPPIPADLFMKMLAEQFPDHVEIIESLMTRKQAIDHLVMEATNSIDRSAATREEVEAGYEDMYRAFEALGVSRKEVDGE
jgi:hypothetical protein